MAEIRFNSPEFKDVEAELGSLSQKLSAIVDDQAAERFGEQVIRDPSDIEVTPAAVRSDEPVFIVNTWHQTGSEQYPGILQPQNFMLRMQVEGKDVYVYVDNEARKYYLTARETLLLMYAGNIVFIRTLLDDSDYE